MLFETKGDKNNSAVLFFHAMGVTGKSSERVAECLKNKYFCIMPTSTVYCAGQKYVSKADEISRVEQFLAENGVKKNRARRGFVYRRRFSRRVFIANEIARGTCLFRRRTVRENR